MSVSEATDRSSADGADAQYPILSPFDGSTVGLAPDQPASAVAAAVAGASAASAAWAGTPWTDRADLLARVSRRLRSAAAEFIALTAAELGVKVTEATMLVERSIDELAYWGALDEGAATARREHDGRLELEEIRRPHGVVAAIAPYNAGVFGAVTKVGPALLTGNVVVLKPAPQTALSARRLGQLFVEEEIPSAVLSVLTGIAPGLGQALVRAPQVRMISFTGSTEVGRTIQADAAVRLARTGLELGGKGALIVAQDADVDAAIEALCGVWTRQAGQICSIPSRAIVHDAHVGRVRERLLARLHGLGYARSSADTDPALCDPVVSSAHAERVEALVRASERAGARAHRLGEELPGPAYVAPTLLEVGDPGNPGFQQEAFGPVLCLTACGSEAEAVELANGTDYGLVNYVFTEDRAAASRYASRLDCGAVVVNGTARHDLASIGGRRFSGIGREGRLEAVALYTDLQSITWTGADPV